ERLVDFGLDPRQRPDVEFGGNVGRHGAHTGDRISGRFSIAGARAVSRCPALGVGNASGDLDQTLNPATELRSSAARRVSWPIDTLVCFVPSVVSSVIFRMSCMPRVTSDTEVDCFC